MEPEVLRGLGRNSKRHAVNLERLSLRVRKLPVGIVVKGVVIVSVSKNSCVQCVARRRSLI
jgi:hypothetical protein